MIAINAPDSLRAAGKKESSAPAGTAGQVDDTLRQILRLYHLAGPVQATGRVYRIGGAGNSCILKPLKIGAAKAYAISRILTQNQCDFLPGLLKSEYGRGYLWYRGNRYCVTRTVPGRPADYLHEPDVDAAVHVMQRWHEATESLLHTDPALRQLLSFDAAASWEKRLRELVACREMAIRRRDWFGKEYLCQWRRYHDQACQALEELKFSQGRSSPAAAICYHDWAFHNVLIDQGKTFLIDFDEILADSAVHDRANLLGRYLRLFHWSTPALLKMLWKFDRFQGWKRGEIRLLRLYLTFPYDFWMLGRQYYIERQPWSREYFREQWRRKILDQAHRVSGLKILEELE